MARDKKNVIVRLGSQPEVAALMDMPALRDCTIDKIEYRYPRVLVSGTICENSKDLIAEMFHQNKFFKDKTMLLGLFENRFDPLGCWRSKVSGTYIHVVSKGMPLHASIFDRGHAGQSLFELEARPRSNYVTSRCDVLNVNSTTIRPVTAKLEKKFAVTSLVRGIPTGSALPCRSPQNALHVKVKIKTLNIISIAERGRPSSGRRNEK